MTSRSCWLSPLLQLTKSKSKWELKSSHDFQYISALQMIINSLATANRLAIIFMAADSSGGCVLRGIGELIVWH
jgi:hypothetical protein